MMNEVIDDQVGSAESYTYEYALANWEQLDINTVRHPLLSSWTFWFNNLKNEVDWVDSLKQVHGFGTIEDFWWYEFYFFLIELFEFIFVPFST